ncbi:hypothetical protein CLF_107564 [Clonorchis sinensis]|uniref:Uncharacterized protein n=1 Tax=Clonorchis sinensis TaxID=79923 RepID=G7YQT4_CLOSI|nr:hypothetical protein CLF_107564 [Clonorchis sinensis]
MEIAECNVATGHNFECLLPRRLFLNREGSHLVLFYHLTSHAERFTPGNNSAHESSRSPVLEPMPSGKRSVRNFYPCSANIYIGKSAAAQFSPFTAFQKAANEYIGYYCFQRIKRAPTVFYVASGFVTNTVSGHRKQEVEESGEAGNMLAFANNHQFLSDRHPVKGWPTEEKVDISRAPPNYRTPTHKVRQFVASEFCKVFTIPNICHSYRKCRLTYLRWLFEYNRSEQGLPFTLVPMATPSNFDGLREQFNLVMDKIPLLEPGNSMNVIGHLIGKFYKLIWLLNKLQLSSILTYSHFPAEISNVHLMLAHEPRAVPGDLLDCKFQPMGVVHEPFQTPANILKTVKFPKFANKRYA